MQNQILAIMNEIENIYSPPQIEIENFSCHNCSGKNKQTNSKLGFASFLLGLISNIGFYVLMIYLAIKDEHAYA